MAYQAYCKNNKLDQDPHGTFIQNLRLACPNIRRGVDKVGGRRILKGIRMI